MLSREWLRESVAHAFGVGLSGAPPQLGLEVEAIPLDARTGRPAGVDVSLRALRALSWTEQLSGKSGVAELRRPDGAKLTFEPGGQIEYSSAPHPSGTALLSDVEGAIADIRGALADEQCSLLFMGLDPLTPVTDVPLQLDAERYRRMDAWFASIGPSGRRMMRQTASIQLCIDTGDHPIARWRLLAALAPAAAAVFANSAMDTGVHTGERSRRRRIWAELDPSRTGLRAIGVDPIEEYLDFAIAAPAFLLGEDPRFALPFDHWRSRGASESDWREHLSTLFPDVRPRGYFEFRVADAVDGDALPALLALVAAPAWHAPTMTALSTLLPPPTAGLMARAGALGLGDSELAEAALTCSTHGLAACEALGETFLDADAVARAQRYLRTYTHAARAPADDVLAPATA